MLDRGQRRAALAGLTLPSRPTFFDVTDAGPATRLVFRGSAATAETVGVVVGVKLPLTPCRAASDGGRHALWLGPDEWMLIGPDQDASILIARLSKAIGNEPHSLVDVSHRNAALILQGSYSADVLNTGCPLNLDAAAFPVGTCVRTLLSKAEIVLWRTASNSFHLEVARSYVPYVVAFIAEAGRDYPYNSRGNKNL